MDKELIEPFFGKDLDVVVGVPHATKPKPFYYYGRIVKLTNEHLILKFDKGIKQIRLEDIIDIHYEGGC